MRIPTSPPGITPSGLAPVRRAPGSAAANAGEPASAAPCMAALGDAMQNRVGHGPLNDVSSVLARLDEAFSGQGPDERALQGVRMTAPSPLTRSFVRAFEGG